MKQSDFFKSFEKEYNKIQNETKEKNKSTDEITADLIKSRGNKIIICIIFCLIISSICSAIFKSFLAFIPTAVIAIVLIVLFFLNNKLLKDDKVIVIEAVCTNKKQDILNFGVNKVYEFEPIDSDLYNDVICLSIANEDTGGLFKKNQKIKIGYTYYLAFKKNDDKKYSNENFLCFKRSVYDEPESKVNKNDLNA